MSLHRVLSVLAFAAVGLPFGGAVGLPFLEADRSMRASDRVILIAEEVPVGETDAAAPAEDQSDRVYLGNEPLESCMKRWDPGTHMTKEEWRKSCQGITEERGPYVKDR